MTCVKTKKKKIELEVKTEVIELKHHILYDLTDISIFYLVLFTTTPTSV